MRYIGCKQLLLKDIEHVIEENIKNALSFCDIFSGTVCVADYFKPRYKIISNDMISLSYFIQKTLIQNSSRPSFKKLKQNLNIDNPIEYFNSSEDSELEKLPQEKRFFQNNYSPRSNRMYITDSNALRIDYIRNKTNEWLETGMIDESEFYYLVTSLIEAVPFISNITGTYGAFQKKWDKRALNKLKLSELIIKNNSRNNEVFCEDANTLVRKISGDILYIDPPYNSRQYFPNYHLLETVALYDNPELKGKTGLREYKDKKSLYCNRQKVLSVFDDLIKNAKFKHIIVSYNNEGLMKVEDIEAVLKKYGNEKTFRLYKIPYRRFKSQNNKETPSVLELIFYIGKEK